jgi:hypothetical protein
MIGTPSRVVPPNWFIDANKTQSLGPGYDWNSFSVANMPDNIDDSRAILDATEADLGPFQSAGGKLLSYFGWADPDINPLTATLACQPPFTFRLG